MAGDLVSIGAVAVDYRRPSLRWTGGPTTHGIRGCSITGLVETAAADELSELVANDELQVTKGGFTGVEEWVIFSGVLASKTGYYLLSNFEQTFEWELLHTNFTGFSLTAAYVGVVS